MRNRFTLSFVAIVAMMFSACTDWVEAEIIPTVPSVVGGSVTQFSAGMAGDESRAGLDASKQSIWHAGDNMTIVKFNPGQTTPQVLHAAALDATISNDGKTMVFACEMPIHAEGEQYAIFPAQTDKTTENYTSGKIGDRSFKVELPEQEIGSDGTFRYPFLLGHWKESTTIGERGSFRFTNPFTILKITLKKPASETDNLVLNSIQVKGNNGELMWGTAEASIIDNGNGTFTKGIKMLQGAELYANLDTRIDGVGQTITTEGKDFYVCIPPQNYSKGMTITFFCQGDESSNIWYMEQPLMSKNGVDCTSKVNTLVNLPALELNVEKSSIFTSLVRSTANTLSLSWTTNVSNAPYLSQQQPSTKANYTAENKNTFIVELWTNDKCQYNTGTLVQSWILRGSDYYYESRGDESDKTELFTKNYAPPRFVFTYLNPSTTYYFRVKYSTAATPDVNDESQWKVLEHPRAVATTDPFHGTSNTIFFEDFRDCVMGGDFSTRSAGYIAYDRSSHTSVAEAVINIYDSSDSESATDISHRLKLPNLEGFGNKGVGSIWAVCPQGKEVGLFNTMRNVVAATTGECPGNYKTYGGYTSKLKDWAWYADDNTAGTILMRAGYVKVGAMFKHAGLVTPELKALTGPSSITVEFYACPYGSSTLDKGELPIAVKVLDGASVYKDTSTTVDERAAVKDLLNRIEMSTVDGITTAIREIELEGNQYAWKKYSVTFSGVMPTSRIAFCSNRPEPNTNNRFLIDDIHIYLNSTDALTAKLVKATDSTLSIAWSSNTANIPKMHYPHPNTSISFSSEYADTYAVAIYDANKTLIGKMSGILWDGAVESTTTSSGYDNLYTAVQKPPRWIFTGLQPSTKYYVKVWNTTKGTESSFVEMKTIAPSYERDDVVPLTEKAVAGHTLLYENFSNMLYGGDHSTRAAGYKYVGSYPAAGRPFVGELTNNRTSGYYTTGAASSVTLFTTAKAQLSQMRMDGWSWVYTDNGTAATGIMIRPGYVQLGTGSVNNCLATPALTNMPEGNSTLRVTFKACPYGAASTSLSASEKLEKVVAVRAHTGGTVGEDYQLTGATVVAERVFTIEGDDNTVWKEYTVDLHHVPQGARVSFGSGRTDYGSNRWHIDDVRIQILNNSDLVVGLVRATDTTLNIGWTVTEGNAVDDKFLTYLPATAASSTATPTYAFDFNSIDSQHNYTIYLYNDEACTNLYQSWYMTSKDHWHDGATTTDGVTTYTAYYPPRFIFSGLTPSTDYYVRVQDNTQGVISSPIKVSTVAPQYQGKNVVTNPRDLQPGNTMIFNNFGKLYYCADLAGFAAGYAVNSSYITSLTENYSAEGTNPYTNDTRTDFDRVNCGKSENAVFTTCSGLVDDFGMSDWSYSSDDGSCRVHVEAGYVKMGGGSQRSTLYTPLLTAIPDGEVWSVKVRFKVCPYVGTNYVHSDAEDDIHVSVYEGGEVTDHKFANGGVVDTKTINISNHVGEWRMHEVTLNNVTCDCRVGIGSARSSSGQSRFFLDDIEVIAASASDVKYLTGYIKDKDGNGVEGVMVSDGYHVVKSNAKGRYRMVYEPSVYKPDYIFYTTPAGYEIGRAGTGLPVTYSKVGDNPDPENTKGNGNDYAKDFTLDAKMTAATHKDFNETTGKHDKWFLFVLADPQTHKTSADNGFTRFRDIVAPDIKEKSASWNSAVNHSSGTGQAYGVICGDVTWNAPEAHHATMKSALEVGDTGVYWFAAPGNHDWYQDDSDTSPNIQYFKDVYGPTRMSFDRGDIHVLIMNNVIVKDGSTSLGVEDYQAGFTEEDLTWLKNDLSHVDKSKGVVLVVHIPFRNGVTSGTKSGANVMKDRGYDVVLTELAKFQHAYIFSGHTHKNQTYVHTGYPTAGGDYVTEVVHTSASGNLWNTSIAPDGSPAGYTIYTFEGPRAKIQRFKAVGYSGSMDASVKAAVWKNNIRMYWGAGKTTGNLVSYYRWNDNNKRVVANVFMSHSAALYDSNGNAIESPKKGIPGELSGDWVVQLYDPALKKWVDMKRIERSRIEQAPDWNSFKFNVLQQDDFLITGDGLTKASGASKPSDGWRIRNDVDWWWWSMTIDGNSNIVGRGGSALGQQNYKSWQSSCTHVWYGDLSYELTADEVKGSSHGVKVRAIPPYYGTNTTVQNAIANGTDLTGSYGIIYVCDTFAQWDSKYNSRTAANSKAISWSTVESAY